ncbi:MAG: type II secretion system protein [Kiritimatiellae bacterium]|nr:type II secretion system protein [Kiritimatiellia bacterium]
MISRTKAAFTLVELLIVIVILGAMAAVVVPTLATGSDYARLRTATRGVVQLSRYAKTMALLHQRPVDLVFSSDGKLSVEPAARSGEVLVSAAAFGRIAGADEVALDAEEIETPAVADGEVPASGGSTYRMADLEIEREYDSITYRFEGYTDTMDSGRVGLRPSSSGAPASGDSDEAEVQSFRVHYKSNGTCRPHRVKVIAGGDEGTFNIIAVNMLGRAKVLTEDEF